MTVLLEADTSGFDNAVDRSKETAESVVRSNMLAMRRGLEIGITVVQAFGVVLDQQLMAWIRVAQVGVETIMATAAAASLGGAFTQLGFGLVQVGFLLAVIRNIRQGRTELATQMQYSVTLLRTTGSFIGR